MSLSEGICRVTVGGMPMTVLITDGRARRVRSESTPRSPILWEYGMEMSPVIRAAIEAAFASAR